MSTSSKEPTGDYWTINQTAAHLGLHPATVTTWARTGRLPAVKLGKRWLFLPDEVKAWVAQQRVAPRDK